MKKNIIVTIGLTIFFIISILAITTISPMATTTAYAFTSGSPGARTNSPADGQTCTGCHAGTINSGTGIPMITAPGLASGYVPGQTYTISGTITQTAINKFGFEVTAEKDLDNTKTGTFIITNATTTKLVNLNNAVSHKSSGTAGSGNKTWSFDWTAPVAGTGNVTFYGAFNATNSNGSSSGDKVYTTSLNVSEDIGVGIDVMNSFSEVKIYPNPAKSFVQISSDQEIENLKIFNSKGQLVLDAAEPKLLIDIRHLPAGMYFVKLSNSKDESIKRLLIQ